MKKIIEFLKDSIKDSIGAEPAETAAASTGLPTETRALGVAMNEKVSTAASVRGGEQPVSVDAPVSDGSASEVADSQRSAEAADGEVQPTETQAVVSGADDVSDFCSQIDNVAEILKGFATRQAELTSALISRMEADSASGETSAEINEALGGLKDISARQEELGRLFDSRIHLDDVQAKAFEHLHDEMQGYKQNFVRQEMLPLLKDVIFSHDVVAKEVERIREQESASAYRAAAKAVDVVGQMLLDILYKYDVEPYRSETEYYDPASQQCVGTEPTDAQGDDKRIAKVGLIGFRTPDSIVRREQVTVYKYKPAEE